MAQVQKITSDEITKCCTADIFTGNLNADTATRLAPLLQEIRADQLKESFEWTYYGKKKEGIGRSTPGKLLVDTH